MKKLSQPFSQHISMMTDTVVIVLGVVVFVILIGIALVALVSFLHRKNGGITHIDSHTIAERVRTVGKLVGLEVCAKEIATAKKGWAWLPPLVLSQARLAMIFQFEKQYFVDLHQLNTHSVRKLAPGKFSITLPPIQGSLRLTDVTPYDIQDGRIMGLLDVIQMNAQAQAELMRRAQDEASDLFTQGDTRYQTQARQAIEQQLQSLMHLFSVTIEIHWQEADESRPAHAKPIIESQQEIRFPAIASAVA